MREAHAHSASVTLVPGGDERAIGAAITVALCGQIDHQPPCPLAPHHTAVERSGDTLRLRILFATDPAEEDDVRRRIDEAPMSGRMVDPDGRTTHWQLDGVARSSVRSDEAAHAGRLATG